MKLVVDANELLAGIITKGKGLQSWTLDVIFSDKVELFAPLRLLTELERNRDEIMMKSGFSSRDFEAFVGVIKLRVKFFPFEKFWDKISEAREISPHTKDVEYFALALKLGCGIWSREKAFREQSQVEVFSAEELVELLGP
jgi:predicted nucleic acid-binding protein